MYLSDMYVDSGSAKSTASDVLSGTASIVFFFLICLAVLEHYTRCVAKSGMWGIYRILVLSCDAPSSLKLIFFYFLHFLFPSFYNNLLLVKNCFSVLMSISNLISFCSTGLLWKMEPTPVLIKIKQNLYLDPGLHYKIRNNATIH